MDETKYRFHLKILLTIQIFIFILFTIAFLVAYIQLESIKNELCQEKISTNKLDFIKADKPNGKENIFRIKRQTEDNRTRKAKINVRLEKQITFSLTFLEPYSER